MSSLTGSHESCLNGYFNVRLTTLPMGVGVLGMEVGVKYCPPALPGNTAIFPITCLFDDFPSFVGFPTPPTPILEGWNASLKLLQGARIL